MVSKGRYIGYTWPSCHISSKVQLPKPPLCGRKDHLVKTTISLQQLNPPFSLWRFAIPDSHPDHSAAKPEPVQQGCLGTLVPDVVVVKVKPLRRAAFQSLRHDLWQLQHAPVAKDFPPGRRSKLMFSMVENSGWETNPKYHHANHSFHWNCELWNS